MSSADGRKRGGLLRFLLRHWAPALVAILAIATLFTAWMMWHMGLPAALNLLPQLAICVALIVAVFVVHRLAGRLSAKNLLRGQSKLVTEQAQQAVADGLGKGKQVLNKGVAGAKEVLGSASDEVHESLDELARSASTGAAVSLPAITCGRCGHAVRVGARFCASCGAPLPGLCPHCQRTLRPGAKFCDNCGQAVGGSQ